MRFPQLAAIDERSLVEHFLAGRSANTRRAYESDLRAFAAWLGVADLDSAAGVLLGRDNAHANRICLAYRNSLTDAGKASATANRRLTAIRSMAKLARMIGHSNVTIDVDGLRREPVRDTRGPGLDGLRALVAAAERRPDSPKKRRDRAILRLLTDLGLRRGEVSSLDVEHFDGERLSVLGKGRRSRVALTCSQSVCTALQAWLDVRPPVECPALFLGLSARMRKRSDRRLGGNGVRGICRTLAREAGLSDVRPHALRHAAITSLLDATRGDVRRVRLFSRHADVGTVLVYDDQRADHAGKLGELLSQLIDNGSQVQAAEVR